MNYDMENITKYSEFNESLIEIDVAEEGVYVLTLDDIIDIVAVLADNQVDDQALIDELSRFKLIKVENPEITEVEPVEDKAIEPVEELSSDDENPLFIKKFEE